MILVTGAAGFIGFHFAKKRLMMGDTVLGIDNLNDYYDVNLKLSRLDVLKAYPNFSFQKMDISDRDAVASLFKNNPITHVVNLAAQAGVRYSIENPMAYIDSNVVGFANIIEGCRHHNIKHLVYASSSSVYGANALQPFSESQSVDHPLALYAATKKSNELIAHSYSSLYGLPTTGLRFFTVYGPWGRPDMALFLFVKAILNNEPVQLFNNGKMVRDFTYVDDIVEGISKVLDKPAEPNADWDALNPDPATSYAPYRVYNIGNSKPVELMEYVQAIEKKVGCKAVFNMLPMQPGDVTSTCANTDKLFESVGFKPSTPVAKGVAQFVDWYTEFYKTDTVI
jgi:UDP-glucuronate 4-epimerase